MQPDKGGERAFAAGMAAYPIAEHTDEANSQHYEIPARFFELCLGPRRKYSCCWYDGPSSTLAEAEVRALALTCEHAALADGQRILELGCGWGSLTLWMAEHYPAATITAVSNSNSQREHIMGEARRRGFGNVEVVTADMNDFSTAKRHDRIVSVEMFEHMANWRGLLERTRGWLADDGLLFVHVFTHAKAPYRFDHRDKTDWIAQHFFTGGIMPSRGLMRQFSDLYEVAQAWDWSGTHYARTARDWLARCDAHRPEIERLFAGVYGPDARLWAATLAAVLPRHRGGCSATTAARPGASRTTGSRRRRRDGRLAGAEERVCRSPRSCRASRAQPRTGWRCSPTPAPPSSGRTCRSTRCWCGG